MKRFAGPCLVAFFVLTTVGWQSAYLPQVTTPPVVSADPKAPLGEHVLMIVAALDRAELSANLASTATSIEELKSFVDAAFTEVWGVSSGLTQQSGAAHTHGWKTRWQARFTAFDEAYGERYGDRPIEISDPNQLGIVGRGRFIRRVLASGEPISADEPAGQFIIGLNNIIGWMRLDDGVTKAERQPRIDLTYVWDSDKSFWQSTADTGWIFVAQAQALNILKSRYTNLETAQAHARELEALFARCVDGYDADGDGEVEPIPAEAGFALSVAQAYRLGIVE